MKIRNDNAPESNGSHGFIRATLAIPENAVRMIAALPETITQRNVEAVTGLPVRTFLELIRSPGFPLRVAKLGKLRLVNRAAFVAWLEQQSGPIDATQMNEPASEVVQEESNPIASILDRVGLQRTRELPKHRNRRGSR